MLTPSLARNALPFFVQQFCVIYDDNLRGLPTPSCLDTMCGMGLQESEAAVASFAASSKSRRRVQSEYKEYNEMLEGWEA